MAKVGGKIKKKKGVRRLRKPSTPKRTAGRLNPRTKKIRPAYSAYRRPWRQVIWQSDSLLDRLVSPGGPFQSANYNFRQFFRAADLADISAFTPTQIRFETFARLPNVGRWDDLYIGPKGTFPNYSAAPTQVTWDGGATFYLFAANEYKWTDWIDYSDSDIDGTADIMISMHCNSAYPATSFDSPIAPAADEVQSKVGATESSLQNVTGYANHPVNDYYCVVAIEVRGQ